MSAASSTEKTSPNWSGFTSAGGGYEAALGDWNIPAIAGSCGSGCDSYSSNWTGLGPISGDPTLLVQVGTESDSLTSGNSYYPWWQECCLQNNQQIISNFPVSRGDSVFAEVYHSGSGTAQITFQDYTSDQSTSFQASWVNSGWTLGTYALWITERTEENGKYPHLANFHQVDWTEVNAQDSAGSIEQLQSLNRYYFYMYNCAGTTLLAKTGDISNQTDFPDIFEADGPVESPC